MIAENGLSDVHEAAQSATRQVTDQIANYDETALETSVYSSLSDAEADWQQLKGVLHDIPYQSPNWLAAWYETLGRTHGCQAAIAVGRINGKPVVILPMAVQSSAGIKTLSFLGHQNGNQNTGCWDPVFYAQARPEQIQDFLVDVCNRVGVDLLALQNVPETWHGRRHPLLSERSTSSPSPIFSQSLSADFDTLFRETHSKSSRKNLLRKQRHLQSAEGYRVTRAETEEDIRRGFAAFVDQRARRAAEAGIPNVFSEPSAQEFLSRLLGLTQNANLSGNPMLHLWFLETGGAIRSTYLCIERAGTIYAYANSIAHDEMMPNSPGLVLIKEIISYACNEPALNTLDLGLGEERYKQAWAEPVPLCDSLLAVTWKGSVKERVDLAGIRAKSAIRNSQALWSLVRRVRKWKAGLSSASNRSD